MSLLHKRLYGIGGAQDLIPGRPVAANTGSVPVTADTALRHSAVWAALRMRADMISTMPVDAYRKVGDLQVEVPKPPVLVNPGGERVDIMEWLYSSEFDLDRGGNAFGLITARSGLGLPARIDLVPLSEVSVQVKDGRLDHYRIGGKNYQPAEVWHERQYTVAGLPVGLSPIAYAAWSIGEYLSIGQFALDWFSNGGIPSGILTNTAKTLTPRERRIIKDRFKQATANRDIFVTGGDWTYQMVQAEQAGADWVTDAKNFGIADAARWFNVPADLLDAAVKTGGDINYANITQRNLQFLILHLDPAVRRRERALSGLLARPRFVKLNRGVVLEMDPKTRADLFRTQIESRTLTPNEARALEDRAPLTETQAAEFDRLFGPPKTSLAPAGAGTT